MSAIRLISSFVSSRWTRSYSTPSLRINEQGLARAVAQGFTILSLAVSLVPANEPEANGYLCGVEELARHGDHAVNNIRLDDVLSELTFT